MIILVAGLPGSGKSYFAERLAERLNADYVNSDRVRVELHASGKYSVKDKLVVYKEMLLKTMKAIEDGRDVVVDATFYHHTMREMFLRLADGYKQGVRLIEVVAEEAIIRERLNRPRKYSEADFGVYEQVRDDFEGITMPHLMLESTDDNLEDMLKSAIMYIEGERE
ncbi:MAG TPA: AAA family ATPase [Chryseosolibacter sp.]|nr:AAA family ATPase [Chryseosolibacter sp.]